MAHWSFFLLLVSVPLGSAVKTEEFMWGMRTATSSTTFGTCEKIEFTVMNGTKGGMGTPPYFMRAWEKGGSVKTQLLGDDPSNLTWTVTSPAGSELFLNIIDSDDGTGGTDPTLFTVDDGVNSGCVTDDSEDSDFTIKSNLSSTSTLSACGFWGIRLKGGVPPYQLSFTQLDSWGLTNVTTSGEDDAYTFVNNADPGQMMIASAVDADGNVAYGNPTVMTSKDYSSASCGSLASSSGNGTVLDAQAAAEAAARDAKTRTTIIGLVVGLGVPLILAILGFIYWWRRRRASPKTQSGEVELFIPPTDVVSPYMVQRPSSQLKQPAEESSTSLPSTMAGNPSRLSWYGYQNQASATTLPSPSPSGASARPSRLSWYGYQNGGSNTSVPPALTREEEEGDDIPTFQHSDAGPVPPPYVPSPTVVPASTLSLEANARASDDTKPHRRNRTP
ncbi:hypothetical protein CYLTODRAFT_421777 [Cylindrobasidium torrendii FP15055 ss-10]|uniref:Mid2 domain-containing protein n=1 Tax=Cylindrobasidium torrendii FP15055 ss-10 TaxID=1314674 RepID=A0A0D7BCM7_9AGAR|nr:hypothetical protein CYLTODRAFT_421777 [Cylindrobasidium torrendii FP15055 ss-10]